MLIDDASPYLTGKADGFSFDVSLLENKSLARGVIAELVDKKVKEAVESIRKCETLAEARAALSAASQGLPSCVPANISVTQLLDRLDIDLAGAIQSRVLSPIPDSITFTESQLRTSLVQAGAGENLEQVDEVRRILKEGWTYTQDDLRATLTENGDVSNVKTLEDIRDFLADGWTYTETDFRDDLSEGGEGGNVNNLDNSRDIPKQSRTYRWVIYIPMIALPVVIGFLGGRGWSGRAVWAAASLLVSAGIIFLIFGPVYGSFAGSALDEGRQEALDRIENPEKYAAGAKENDYHITSSLAANKVFDMLESVADDFASGIASPSLKFAIIGLVALLATIFRSTIMGAARRVLPSRGQDPPE